MTYPPAAALALLLLCFAAPAWAQSVPGGQGSGPTPPARQVTPDLAPPALPGAGAAPGIATAPKVQMQNTGDPTVELFTAINANDYNSAQDAISRGANLSAQNTLGETPLDMSIDLNQNSITFLLLSTRNEDGASAGPAPAEAMQPPSRYSRKHQPAVAQFHPGQRVTPAAPRQPGDNPGTPNAGAGFLGFGPSQ